MIYICPQIDEFIMASRKSRGKHNHSGKTHKRQSKEKASLGELTGRVQMTREGYIFVIPEEGDKDVFVRASRTAGALNGDIVKVSISRLGDEKHHSEGRVIEIIKRSEKPFVGILHVVGNKAWVLMQSRTMPYDISIAVTDDNRDELKANSGMKAAAVIDGWKKGAPGPEGHIVDILGMPGENDTEMHAILAEFALPYKFEKEVENAADSISEEITEADLKDRKDFRDILTFTIDPADAKDFDDALSFRPLDNGNFEVGVHIADVTHYVRPGDIVDEEARKRGTSVYLVDRTVPMLPEKLSNKLCSLRPGEEKLTFSAVFEINSNGTVKEEWFGRTVIKSDWRFAYEQAQAIIEGTESPDIANSQDTESTEEHHQTKITSDPAPDNIKEAVLTLNKIALKLRKKRFAAGAISFERPEMKVEVDEKGRPVRIYQKITKEANWLIEEFMLLANRSVAKYVATQCKKSKDAAKTFVYRVHDEPNLEKLENLRKFIGNFGYKMGPTFNGKEVSKELNELFTKAKDTPEFGAIELLSLRTMAKARYDTENIGHYGLAFQYYTHFTSPIRRYPDMMVHRLLAKYLKGGDSAQKDVYDGLCKYASEREIIAADAERASVKYKLVEFMQDKVGSEFDGHVSGLTDWGMYVQIEPTQIEGMVALRDIKSDFFEFDEEHYRIVGRHSRITYNLGDPVRVRVTKADLNQKQLDYELVETGLEEREDKPAETGANKAARKAKIKKAIKLSKKQKKKKEKSNSHNGK